MRVEKVRGVRCVEDQVGRGMQRERGGAEEGIMNNGAVQERVRGRRCWGLSRGLTVRS